MKITGDNYEVFFLDFLDGNLEEQDMDQFLDFLEQNPDLKDELQSLQQIRLADEQIAFPGRERLYKTQAEETADRENKLVAYLEGDLDDAGRETLETYLASHPDIQKEYQLFAKTRLIPDGGIQYPDKRKLYRKPASVIVMNWVARAAAVVLLVWGIHAVIQNQNEPVMPKADQEIAAARPQPEIQAQIPEAQKKETTMRLQEKSAAEKESRSAKLAAIRPKTIPDKQLSSVDEPIRTERDEAVLAEILPIEAKLEMAPEETALAVERSVRIGKVGQQANVMNVEEFLAQRAEKVGKEGLLSVQRIARMGLGIASEISGDRISYREKDGKIASVEFESKLLAFTIPLEKK